MTTTDTEIHPYYTARAELVLRQAGGDPALAGPLAAWAQDAHRVGDTRRGVIVAETGAILAETRYVPSTVGSGGATYVTSGALEFYELGMAIGKIERQHGARCIHVTFSQVCLGAGSSARVTDRA